MSDRFVALLLVGALPLFFIGSYPAAFGYLALYNTLAFGIWLWDRKHIRHNLLLIDREFSPQWALGQTQRLTLSLMSESGFPLKVDLHETLPESLAPAMLTEAPIPARELDLPGAQEVALLALGVGLAGGADAGALTRTRRTAESVELADLAEEPSDETPAISLDLPLALAPQSLTLRPYGTMRLAYALTPTVRGSLKLGQISVRLSGPLGLAWTRQQRNLPADVEVVGLPEVAEALDAPDRRAILPELGQTNSRRKGGGLELESLRDYVAGDEFRKIAWKATAKRGRAIVKQTVEEVSQTLVILMDTGRRMGVARTNAGLAGGEVEVGSHRPLRLDLAMNAASLLSRAALKQGHRVGFLCFADRVGAALKPRPGPRQFAAIRRELEQLRPNQFPTDYTAVAAHLLACVQRRALVVLLTEPPASGDTAQLEKTVQLLHSRHRTVVVTLQDPAYSHQKNETVRTPESIYLRTAANDLLKARMAALEPIQRMGVPVLDVPPSGLTMRTLNKLLAQRC